MKRVFLAVALTALTATVAVAQPEIAAGTRVRVSGRASLFEKTFATLQMQQIGISRKTDRTAMLFQPETDTTSIVLPFMDLQRVEVSEGRKDHKVMGGVIGGIVSGGAFVGLACAFSNGSCNIGDHVGGFIAYYAVGAIPGIVVGASVGSQIKSDEQWREVWGGPRSVALRIGATFRLH